MEAFDIILVAVSDGGFNALGGVLAGSIVAVSLGAFKLIDRIMLQRAMKSGQPGDKAGQLMDRAVVACCPSDVKAAIFEGARNTAHLVRQHAPEGGVERWKQAPELMAIIQSVGETQRIQVRLMERWDETLEKHREREESLMAEIRDVLQGILHEIK